MSAPPLRFRPEDVLTHLANAQQPGALAIIVGVEGPSYRPIGAIMACYADGSRQGILSSGCIEQDVCQHAQRALETGVPQSLRYGIGSPFFDIQLPCGGGLDILVVPPPDAAVLADLQDRLSDRVPVRLAFDLETGAFTVDPPEGAHESGMHFVLDIPPPPRFLVFGKGPEAAAFAALVGSLAYPVTLLSPDPETLFGVGTEVEGQELTSMRWPEGLTADRFTAVTLFFHDHEWEPPILEGALATPAFYIGAQGSLRTRANRDRAMAELGITQDQIARCHGPIGLVRSTRDPHSLAVSVLAEVLDQIQTRTD
ncbi:MAG: XdhC family protein [Pseudomonadota bacterium]